MVQKGTLSDAHFVIQPYFTQMYILLVQHAFWGFGGFFILSGMFPRLLDILHCAGDEVVPLPGIALTLIKSSQL